MLVPRSLYCIADDSFQADLHGDESSYRKMKLIVEDIQGKVCLTNFHGMSLTRFVFVCGFCNSVIPILLVNTTSYCTLIFTHMTSCT